MRFSITNPKNHLHHAKENLQVHQPCLHPSQDDEITTHKCLNGVIYKTTEGFRFEEAVRKGRPKRNPKLFDGKFCSLVHMANGKYQIHMKTIDASGELDRQELAFKVYSELLNAFNIID